MNHSLREVNLYEQHLSLSCKIKQTRMGSFKTALETSSLWKVGALEGSLHITVSSKSSYLPHQGTEQEEAETVHMEAGSSALQSRGNIASWVKELMEGIGVSRGEEDF